MHCLQGSSRPPDRRRHRHGHHHLARPGAADNWAALTSGTSGIHAITRFPTDGLSTRIAGTVDFIDIPVPNAVERSYAFARETTDRGAGAGRPLRRFQRAAVPRRAADRAGMERPFRRLPTVRRRPIIRAMPMSAFSPRCASVTDPAFHEAVAVRRDLRAACRPLRHARPAGDAVDGLRFGRHRHPARRRGDPPGPHRPGADGRDRRFGQRRSADPLLAAVGAFDPERSADQGLQAVQQGSRRLRHRRRCRDAGAGIAGIGRCARRQGARHHEGLPAKRPTASTAPARRRMAARRSPTIRAALADAGIDEDGIGYINAHGTSTPENDKMEYMSHARRVRRAGWLPSRCRRTSR